jgi:hypothetical protein
VEPPRFFFGDFRAGEEAFLVRLVLRVERFPDVLRLR